MQDFDIDVDCPQCGYPVWIRASELAVELTVRCPCCRTGLRLRNPDGSAATIDDDIDRIVDDHVDELLGQLDRVLGKWMR